MGRPGWDAGQTLGGDSEEMQELLGGAGCGGGTQHPHEAGKEEHGSGRSTGVPEVGSDISLHSLRHPCLWGLSLQSACSPLVCFSAVLLPFFLLFLTLKVLFIIPIANTFSKTMNSSFCFVYGIFLGFPSGSMVKNLPVMQ